MASVCGRVRALPFRARLIGVQQTAPFSSTSGKNNSQDASSHISRSVDFSDESGAYGHVPTTDLLRSLAVLRLCKIPAFVQHADRLVAFSNKFLGASVTSWFAKKTFFGHFCAGEDENDIAPVIAQLESRGVGGILDYAAEADVSTTAVNKKTEDPRAVADAEGRDATPYMLRRTRSGISARTYEYVNEKMCDENKELFESCINSVHNVSPEGFAAVKLTALGNPKLLERASDMLVATSKLFDTIDSSKKGFLSFDDFATEYPKHFILSDGDTIESVFDRLFGVSSESNRLQRTVDLIEWKRSLNPKLLSWLALQCIDQGPFYKASLDAEELGLYADMMARVDAVCALANEKNVRLMLDAEQTYFQSAIDAIVLEMQKRYNTTSPIIFNTYQCYLKDSHDRVARHVERARREGWIFAAKLVRGAYMTTERARAAAQGYPDPVHDTIEDTHANYHDVFDFVMNEIVAAGKDNIEKRGAVVVASHNQTSCERAIQRMSEHGIAPGDGVVYFGQLLGMADNLTFNLGAQGYSAYKYVPYGPVQEVMPYLIRRAQENSDVLSGAAQESAMMRTELRNRGIPFV